MSHHGPTPSMKVQLKIGRHKYHRSPFYTSSAYKEMVNEYKDFHRDSNAMEDMMYDLQTEGAEDNELQNMHWTIGHDVLDVADEAWNDPSQFKPSSFTTHRGKKIIRKCKESFCLCQYIDGKEDGHQKHLCKPALKADKSEPLGPSDLMRLVHVMDSFISPIHILTPLLSAMNALPPPPPFMPPPLPFIPFAPHMNALNKPMFHRMPYIHILHLRALPPRSLFGSHKYRIPWNKYRKFKDLMPRSKPQWLPLWIWKQVQRGMGSNKIAAADMESEDYYDYNVDLADFYDEMSEREDTRRTLLGEMAMDTLSDHDAADRSVRRLRNNGYGFSGFL